MKLPVKAGALLALPVYFSLNLQSLDAVEGNEGVSTTFGGITFGGSLAGAAEDNNIMQNPIKCTCYLIELNLYSRQIHHICT